MPDESSENLKESQGNQTKCSALIPNDLLEKLKESGYNNRAEAIRLGLECLLKESQQIPSENHTGIQKNPEESHRILKEPQENHRESLGNLRESVASLTAQNDELEKHNQTLKEELEEAKRDKEDLKTTYNNYFLQVQTLINQKAIEAPGEKKRWWKFW